MSRRDVCLLLCLLASLVACVLLDTQGLQRLENASWDYRQTLMADPSAADSAIKIIEVSQADLDLYATKEFQSWPWPRSFFGAMVQYLEQAGARGVAIDILFTEQSVHGVHEDQLFADLAAGPITLVNAIAGKSSSEFSDSEEATHFQEIQNRAASQQKLFSYLINEYNRLDFPSAALPGIPIMDASDALGLTSVEPDPDGVLRRFRVGGKVGATPVLGLPFALYSKEFADRPLALHDFFDEQGCLVPRFFGPQRTYKTYSSGDVLASFKRLRDEREPLIALTEFQDSWVFIGATAPGLLDYRPIPIPGKYPGVELNATIFDNLVNGHFVKTMPRHWSWLLILVLVSLSGAIQFFIRLARNQVALQSLLFIGYIGICIFATGQGLWLPLAAPLLGLLIIVPAALLYQYQSEGRQRRFIKKAFSHYLSPEVINLVTSNPDSLVLGGERRELSIFFSDIAGFTSISESLDPSQLVTFLNRYLSVMTDVILESGGTLDKYEGDAIIAFWNAPLAVTAHPQIAVQAALDCQRKLADLREEFKAEYGIEVFTRIGIHTGEVNVGNFGSQARFDYTIIGDAANLASRLEGVNKVFGSSILISGSTAQRLSNSIAVRRLGSVRVVGKATIVEVFEPFRPNQFSQDKITGFEKALKAFEAGDLSTARSSFASLTDDRVAEAYIRRIEQELQSGVPGRDFDPIWNLTSK